MNEIKLDKVDGLLTVGTVTQNVKQAPSDEVKKEGVTVTNTLSRLVSLLNGGESIVDEHARVAETKRMIQSGNYVVNFSDLSEKILDSGVLSGMGA